MSARKPIPALPVVGWQAIWPGVDRLRKTGHPDRLKDAAQALDAFPEVEGAAEAADLLRRLEASARLHLVTLERLGISYDFDKGVALLPSGGRRGPRDRMLSQIIAAAFRHLDPAEWYSGDTYRDVRKMVATVIGADEAEALTDSTVRGAIERTAGKEP